MPIENRKEYSEISAKEIAIDWNGWSFLIIYGKHINGWFIAVPNWKICVEATDPSTVHYNICKLSEAFNDADKGNVVATTVKEHWEGRFGKD